jgi:hypothetical protein
MIYRTSDGKRNVVIPPGNYKFDEYFPGIPIGGQRKLAGNIFFTEGEYYNGDHSQQRANVTWRQNRQLSLDLSFTRDKIKLPYGNFTLRRFGFTTQYAFSATLSWSDLVQYDNISENMASTADYTGYRKQGSRRVSC